MSSGEFCSEWVCQAEGVPMNGWLDVRISEWCLVELRITHFVSNGVHVVLVLVVLVLSSPLMQ